jgi:hypothetical protein
VKHSHDDIVNIIFTVLGAKMTAQYDSGNGELYAFTIKSPNVFFEALGDIL